jgi:hypothetical protein
MNRGADARVGLGAGHDQPADSSLRELGLERGVLERVAVFLVHEWL